MYKFLVDNSLKLSFIFLSFFYVYFFFNFEYSYDYLKFFFIGTLLFSILICLKFSEEKNNETIIVLFIFFTLFYNLYFYIFYFFQYLFFEENDEAINKNLFFYFLDNYKIIISVILSNFTFYFFFIFFFKVFFKTKNVFNFDNIKRTYSTIHIILMVGSIFFFIFLNKHFIQSKVLYFLTSDALQILLVFSIIYYFNSLKLSITLKFILLFSIIIIYTYVLFISEELNIFTLDRGALFIIFITFVNFFFLSIFFKIKYLKKILYFFLLLALLTPFFIFNIADMGLFHLLSETQINRNLSIIIFFVEERNLEFEKLDYITKLIFDILPFTGSQRGYTSNIIEFLLELGQTPGETGYNFGVLSEGYLFFGFFGIILIAFIISIILKFINYLFYKFRNDLFICVCFCHFLTQFYWLYRGGMSLFVRKLYYFSFLYLVLFFLLVLFQIFYSQKNIK